MSRRETLFVGLVLFLAIAGTARAVTTDWGPRTLHPNELYSIYGGGSFADKCCDRLDEVCDKDFLENEGECDNNDAGTACKQDFTWLIDDGNRLFCVGDMPDHHCSEDTHNSPHFCQAYIRCTWDPVFNVCMTDSIVSSDESPEYCNVACPIEADKP